MARRKWEQGASSHLVLRLASLLFLGVSACSTYQKVNEQATVTIDKKGKIIPNASETSVMNGQQMVMTAIYAEANWYLASPEPEKLWQGLLQQRNTQIGPANRTGLIYTLVTDGDQIPVYAASAEHLFAAFVGKRISVIGKIVDLSNEGFSEELWIASIKVVEPE